MTTQNAAVPSAPEKPAPQTPAADFEITDVTKPEVDEAYALERPDKVVPETQTPAVTKPETPVTPPAGTAKPEPVSQPKEEPKPRVFSDEDRRAMQAGYDRRIADLERQTRESQQRLESFDVEAQVEGYRRQQEQVFINNGHTPQDAAALSQPLAQERRQYLGLQNTARRLYEERQALGAQSEEAAKRAIAVNLIQKHSLPETDMPILLQATTPDGLLALADRLGRVETDRKALAVEKQARVPAGTNVESGPSSPSAPPQNEELIARYADGDPTLTDVQRRSVETFLGHGPNRRRR